MKNCFISWSMMLAFCCICTFAAAQSSSSIVLDASSLTMENTDAVTGLNIDPVGLDRSNRPCARIKLHINRMTREEIGQLQVKAPGGVVYIAKNEVAVGGDGLIIEMTARPQTTFFLYHEKLGYSNSVTVNLEGHKVYKMEAWNETKLSVVVSYSSPGADVYLDGEYMGIIPGDNHLSIRDVTMGSHQLRVKTGMSDITRQINVSPDQVFFNLDARANSNLQGFVLFKVDRNDALVWLDGEQLPVNNGLAQKLVKYGTYSYSVYSQGHYTVQGEVVVDSGQIVQNVVMDQVASGEAVNQERGRVRISGGNSDGAEVYVDSEYAGVAPFTTQFLSPGLHTIRVHKQNYIDYESGIYVDQGSIFVLSPVLKPDFMTVRLTADKGAEIWINGELKGTDIWVGDLANGDYVVESRKENHIPATDKISVRENMPSTDIRLPHLQPISGFLSVTSDPIGASILIDGELRGATPLFINDVSVGQHNVSVIKDGYEQWSGTVTISEGNETSIAPLLRRMLGVETMDVSYITEGSARCGGVIVEEGDTEVLSKGVIYSLWPDPTVDLTTKVETGDSTEEFTCEISGLLPMTKYYVRAYIITADGVSYGSQKEFSTQGEKVAFLALDLAEKGSANCYIIDSPGTYCFPSVKGNSSESVGAVGSVDVLWESFGTSEKPSVGSLINNVFCQNGKIIVRTSDILREGNAVVAAKDNKGTILWSWHIWITDQPQEQVYPNDAGTMMDRNLGATSTTPGSLSSLGLLYQWGRKDPFLNGMDVNSTKQAKSTKNHSSVNPSAKARTPEYTIKNPTAYVEGISPDYYSWMPQSQEAGLWAIDKTIYDPCPVGWRVPTGGRRGVWATAELVPDGYVEWNSIISFDSSDELQLWYPASSFSDLDVDSYVQSGHYWSVLPDGDISSMFFTAGVFAPSKHYESANAFSVRCQKEGTGHIERDPINVSEAVNLAVTETANCYVVTSHGTYSFPTTRGNSSKFIDEVASAEVLWESYGTNEGISKGDLIAEVMVQDSLVYFKTLSPFREGNAVIAAKDSSGAILWSWHIWMTDEPQEQVYAENAGTMMDRNLGATSATPGDVAAFGLFYQWGRKDPFLGLVASTISWPKAYEPSFRGNIIVYSVQHPATYIIPVGNYGDWNPILDDTRWQSRKTINDPCPAGWRVPDSGPEGIWKDVDASSVTYDSFNSGMSVKTGDSSTAWYPVPGYRNSVGMLINIGNKGSYWSVNSKNGQSYYLSLGIDGDVSQSKNKDRASGLSVRCVKE